MGIASTLVACRGTHGKGFGISSKSGFEPRAQSGSSMSAPVHVGSHRGIQDGVSAAGIPSGDLQNGGLHSIRALQDTANTYARCAACCFRSPMCTR